VSSPAPPPAPAGTGIGSRLAALLLPRALQLSLGIAALFALGLAMLPRLQIQSGLDVFSDKDSPLRQVLSEVNTHFVNDQTIFIAYSGVEIFSPETLRATRALGESLEGFTLPGGEAAEEPLFPIDQVTSLTTVEDLVGSDLSFKTTPLIPAPVPTDESLQTARARALNNPVIRGNLLSEDGAVAVLSLRLAEGLDDAQRAETIVFVRERVRDFEAGVPGLRALVAGDPVVRADIASYQASDLGKFIPLAYALITLLLYVFMRRVKGVAIALVMVTVCLVLAIAVLTAIGSSINNCSVMLPPVMVALSVAMLLHYVSELGKNARRYPRDEAVTRTFGELIPPVFMAALTTAIGFGALAVSRVPAVHEFGITAGAAMLLAFLSITVLMALAAKRLGPDGLIAPTSVALSAAFDGLLERLARGVTRWRWPLLAACALFVALISSGAARIVIDTDNLALFDRSAPVRQAAELVDARLGGSVIVVASVRAPEDERFLQPETLRALEGLTRFMEDELGAGKVTSALDYVKLMHREFFNGDPAAFRIPDNAAQVAQLLVLNGDTTFEEYLDQPQRWARVVARFDEHSSVALDELYARLDAELAARFPAAEGWRTAATGNSRIDADMVIQLVHSQATGLLVASALIFGLMFLMFRSLRTGLVSLAPNLLPIATNLGLMGWLGIRLDASTVMISTVALGIAVDDTVHFLQHLRARLGVHGDLERAVRETFHTKGPAIIWTSIVISLGFCVVLVSSFSPTRNFGLLICVAMLAALLADLVLLPALLLCLRTRLGVRPRDELS